MTDRFKRLAAIACLIMCAAVVLQAASTPKQKQSPAKPKKPPVKQKAQLPKLLELGSTTCMPCRMMEPVLDQLRKEYKGKLTVQFIDIEQNEKAAEKYGIKLIPTQIFFDSKGKEIFRHVGYFPKKDILKAFEDKGIDLDKKAQPAPDKPKDKEKKQNESSNKNRKGS